MQGTVTLAEMRLISDSKDQILQLFKVADEVQKDFSFSSVNNDLQQRIKEFQTFNDFKTMYLTICNWIPQRHCFSG